MKIVLTHEQADFDAIASLLGAFMLEGARPVLPRRTNRNVRSFLIRHKADLPFLDSKDLPQAAIESVLLVDTQSLITLKGMSANTHIEVIDHHSLRPNLSDDWQVLIDEAGACTTIFVERIQQASLPLNKLEATLLLLGIYEDTGSLTYTRTTVRDVRAAAYLLEQGASLQIAGDYLYPPLSDEQRRLYDELLANTDSRHIQGQQVILAHAFAEEMTDEVSSAAHKIRDLLDPDALILVISTHEGIRLVARSTSDQVDVSAIAAHFGGGGHARAAAALIRLEDDELDENRPKALNLIYQQIIDVLPRFVKPAVQVGEVMSSQPTLLKPEQSATEALKLMQRYGYEGFPVVENGRVIGLLTRRAVDRALAHRLNLRVNSLMEAGEVTIHPDQTLEELQALMNASGWGQIPVIRRDTGEIVGIVTRTDLIKTLSNGQKLPAHQNLAEKLESVLPHTQIILLKRIAVIASAQNLALFIVGGFVRDMLLERPSLDFDLVVEGNAIQLAQALAEEFGGKVVSHRRFGTAKWRIGEIRSQLASSLNGKENASVRDLPESLDLISARTEFYDHPTALPVVERSSIKLDLHRRDFSINTLALRLDGSHYGDLYDYWGGLSDLQKGFIRVLHSLSFVDDPTRLLRAVRFEQRFNFQIENRTQQLMHEAHSLMRQVSGDRIRHELDLILNEPRVLAMLNRLAELGLLQAISPSLVWNPEISSSIEAVLHQSPQPYWNLPDHIGNNNLRQAIIYLGWLTQIPHMQAISASKRLKLSSRLVRSLHEIDQARKALAENSPQKPSQYVRILDGKSAISLYILACFSPQEDVREAVTTYIQKWQQIKPLADGQTLRESGIPPGPVYRKILEKLRDAWLNGEIQTLSEENRLLDELTSEITAGEN